MQKINFVNITESNITMAYAYHFGFNGKLNDDEVFGATGSFQDYGMRMYDTRVCRFISKDPLTKKYPELTPYQFASNTPIMGIDLDGCELLPTNKAWYNMNVYGTTTLQNGNTVAIYETVTTENVPEDIFIVNMPGISGANVPGNISSVSETPTNPDMPSDGSSGVGPYVYKPKKGTAFISEKEKSNNNSTNTGKGMTAAEGLLELFKITYGIYDFVENSYPALILKRTEYAQRYYYYRATKIVDFYTQIFSNNKDIDTKFFSPQARTDLVNYILDGTVPQLMDDNSDYVSGIISYGNEILKNQSIEFQPDNQNAPQQSEQNELIQE